MSDLEFRNNEDADPHRDHALKGVGEEAAEYGDPETQRVHGFVGDLESEEHADRVPEEHDHLLKGWEPTFGREGPDEPYRDPTAGQAYLFTSEDIPLAERFLVAPGHVHLREITLFGRPIADYFAQVAPQNRINSLQKAVETAILCQELVAS